MKEFDPLVLLAVFREMLGPWQWLLLPIAVVGLFAFLRCIVRDRGLVAGRLRRARRIGLLGGVLALVVLVEISAAGFVGAGGPVDWLLFALVFAIGVAVAIVIVYPLLAWRDDRAA
ncbi:MAG: DUF5368 domain-containing protein [Azonexus sp.]|jgi:hypothetical protein|uniref:DUF5368 family protein n=1 Tax=Azonexus sp. TaxID=1872668 RepID=UPI002827865B|nr:DUF5368 family protein [Azonexus sp.]MDR0777235.1 DUF5368 domain-containing protein [Azonexus sp.]